MIHTTPVKMPLEYVTKIKPLCSYRLVTCLLIVYLKSDGTPYNAEKVKSSTKKLVCIPCTDESESRTSTNAIDYPHPLIDQIKYLSTQNYLDNLKKWMDYLQDNPKYLLAYQAIAAVYYYMVKGTLLDDLHSFQIPAKDKMVTGFSVSLNNLLEDKLWMMPELWEAWIDFYRNEDIAKRETQGICYITGNNSTYTQKHSKSINRASGNAKLITGNDDINFTFRGRFEEPSQAVTVSY